VVNHHLAATLSLAERADSNQLADIVTRPHRRPLGTRRTAAWLFTSGPLGIPEGFASRPSPKPNTYLHGRMFISATGVPHPPCQIPSDGPCCGAALAHPRSLRGVGHAVGARTSRQACLSAGSFSTSGSSYGHSGLECGPRQRSFVLLGLTASGFRF
ncbi:unnamed protein product, partial [Pleuronectes platessa]